jgi:hypothetical protein
LAAFSQRKTSDGFAALSSSPFHFLSSFLSIGALVASLPLNLSFLADNWVTKQAQRRWYRFV